MIPVIAIVGRPNVGKSTLFNRLTETRDALVSDFPGMTRDRQYGEAERSGFRFIVIDTGGMTEETAAIEQQTTAQALKGIQDADSILFLVDARSGLTAADQQIADKLRRIKKPIFLVVNKAEEQEEEIVTADFFKLGLTKPIAISAAHDRGVSELVETVFKDMPAVVEEPAAEDSIKLAIVGRPNVGKSTLTNRMLGEERVIVFDLPGTTRDSIFIPMERQNKKYTLIDTAGIRRKGKVFEAIEKFSVVKTLQAIEAANVVLFLVDANEGITEQDLKLLGFILDSGKGMVIACNKWDGLSLEARDHTRKTIDRRLNFLPFVRVHFISALHGTGVGNLFDSIQEAYRSATKKLATKQLTKLLQEAIETHTPPLVGGRRIKLRYAHAGGHNPPRIVIHGNQVKSLPDAYKRFLANFFQQKLKLMGTPVYIELKSGENPFKGKKNVLTSRQKKKKIRLMRHVKK